MEYQKKKWVRIYHSKGADLFHFKFTFLPGGTTDLNSGSLHTCTSSIKSTPLNNLKINSVKEPLEGLAKFKVHIWVLTPLFLKQTGEKVPHQQSSAATWKLAWLLKKKKKKAGFNNRLVRPSFGLSLTVPLCVFLQGASEGGTSKQCPRRSGQGGVQPPVWSCGPARKPVFPLPDLLQLHWRVGHCWVW